MKTKWKITHNIQYEGAATPTNPLTKGLQIHFLIHFQVRNTTLHLADSFQCRYNC